MDRKLENPGYILKEEVQSGTVKIADDVIASIAGIAATEVEGVAGMAGNAGTGLLSKVGIKNPTQGVKVYITGRTVRADLDIVVDSGYNIPAVSAQVQEKVKSTIESMTGLTAADVNIRVAGVNVKVK